MVWMRMTGKDICEPEKFQTRCKSITPILTKRVTKGCSTFIIVLTRLMTLCYHYHDIVLTETWHGSKNLGICSYRFWEKLRGHSLSWYLRTRYVCNNNSIVIFAAHFPMSWQLPCFFHGLFPLPRAGSVELLCFAANNLHLKENWLWIF